MIRRFYPYIFDDFFISGFEESISPFLNRKSRKWAQHFPLKQVFCAAIFFLISFILSFFYHNISYLLLSFVYFIVTPPAIINAYQDVKNWQINIDTLMTTVTIAALIIGSPFEGALLLILFQGAGALEYLVTHKAKSALYSLHQLVPKTVEVIKDHATEKKTISSVSLNDHIVVAAGETIPFDGTVTEGSSHIDLSHLTGEHVPIYLEKQGKAISGSKVLEGRLVIRVERTGNQTTLMQLIEMITNAQKTKPPVEKTVHQFVKKYAPSIILCTILFALFFPIFFSMPYLGKTGSIYRSLAFLIAASPCALILGIPMTYFSAISATCKKGILIKGGGFFDILAKVKYIAFDKTGTLTTENICSSFSPIGSSPLALEDAKALFLALTHQSTHPLSQSIARFCSSSKEAQLLDFTSIAGKGLEGKVLLNNHTFHLRLGQKSFLFPHLSDPQKSHLSQSEEISSVYALIDHYLYLFTFAEKTRKHLKKTISHLQDNFQVIALMLTGDTEKAAQNIAKKLGIQEFYAHLTPEEKLRKIAALSKKKPLAMVGDGINDAPALARADVGIALGKLGSSAASYASDIVFLHDDLSLLPWLFKQAKRTRHIIFQNMVLALCIICFASIPALLDWIPIWAAVLLHEGGTLIVGINSLRLLKKQ